ncbi:GxxExxY protein [Clostridium guangxiense]|uniref:GxxExxY protein n=1 Tax=Clostridium guangxiense TaxID=1662055 RepID=UPI001E588876|nr:AAA family ATPase [Clostridium guangxiense]MCD2345251.1 AAA family ATPase [Clostridium guangxiense]
MKRFNTTGVCIPEKDFMVDVTGKVNQVESMIDRGEYFIINRPRQYGKTTILFQLYRRLKNKYLIIRTSFEGLGDLIFKDEEIFSSRILDVFSKALRFTDKGKSEEIKLMSKNSRNLEDVSEAITEFVVNSEKEVILFIDEVDKSSNNQLFLSFLGMLRNKFLLSRDDLDYTFKSVILTGVYDVKNLKLKLRPREERKYNSHWNIAVNFEVDLSFKPKEIESMLHQYNEERNITMNYDEIANKLYYYTNGYPFLVSRLCQIIDERILKPEEKSWTTHHIDEAVKCILKENNTLFDDLVKNLENNSDLYGEVYSIVIDGEVRVYNNLNPTINIGTIYGIFKEDDNKVTIHNRIYEQIIYNYMISKIEAKVKMSNYNFRDNFIIDNDALDLQKILLKFQQFIKEQYSEINTSFLEREGRLIFLAFLKPIINGIGFDFKEVQISQEKRLDVVVTYGKNKYVIELKIWHGEEYHKKGLQQLYDYLEIQNLDKGYLLIYNFNKNKQYKNSSVKLNNKEIFMVWV